MGEKKEGLTKPVYIKMSFSSYNLPERYHENMETNKDCMKAIILCGGPAKGELNLVNSEGIFG